MTILTGHRPYPEGPKNEADAVLAAHEVNSQGLLTGGPKTPEEWRHWNALSSIGHIGRFHPPGEDSGPHFISEDD